MHFVTVASRNLALPCRAILRDLYEPYDDDRTDANDEPNLVALSPIVRWPILTT